jgi:hypothetical protein
MTALAAPRDTKQNLTPGPLPAPVADNVKIWQGSIVMLSAGLATPGATATGKFGVGRARKTYDNTVVGHAASAFTVEIEEGEFWWANGDSIVRADVGKPCFIVDDQTVSKGNTSQSPGGIIVDVDSTLGVCVRMSLDISQAIAVGVADAP